jgi:hypothetical protein
LLANPKLLEFARNNRRNDALFQELDRLEAELKKKAIPVPDRRDYQDMTHEIFVRKLKEHDDKPHADRLQQDREKLTAQGKSFSTSAATVYQIFLAEGGEQQLEKPGNDPLDNLNRFVAEARVRHDASGLTARLKALAPQALTPPEPKDRAKPTDDEAKLLAAWPYKSFRALRAWEQFEREGGLKEFDRLGCAPALNDWDAEGIERHLAELRKAKMYENYLSNLPPAAPGANGAAPAAAAPAAAQPATAPAATAPPPAAAVAVARMGKELQDKIKTGQFEAAARSGFTKRWEAAIRLARDQRDYANAAAQLQELQADLAAATRA